MKRFKHIVIALSFSMMLFGCSDAVEDIAEARAITFSIPRGWPGDGGRTRAGSPAVFAPDDKIGVYACYTPQSGETEPFTANFMRNQSVTFDGTVWSYSPVKYWPTDGTIRFFGYFPYDTKYGDLKERFDHECITGLEPLYGAHAAVKAENGKLSGDGISATGSLKLGFTPLLNKVNFSAKADEDLFDEVESDEYTDCFFLIKEFRIKGFYRKASYDMADATWSAHETPYTGAQPLDMSLYLDLKDTEEELTGYKYNPDQGYCTDRAVIIHEGDDAINIFGKSAYFIPMDGLIAGNDPGFEIVYVVVTKKKDANEYKESGIVTRSGSLREIFYGQNGLIQKIINVNLEFSVDGVTVTRELTDYKYKPMF